MPKPVPLKANSGRRRANRPPLCGLPHHWRTCIVRWAKMRPVIAEIWLFGSRAREMHRPKSDIDLGVVIDGADYTALFFNWRKLKDLPVPALPVDLHLERYEPEDDGVVASAVRRDGRRIYRRVRPRA
jgi:predicted nucleotidyltransferase